ncbi:unnamed protein product [Caenorhabditis auriculariae]|uniref:Uncharacterized protein n=1 Tax=Caenorhabditis auriculariae TaxID=2777116 RepID=A0A8S1HP29_9PELO|nr:unnamed protein product [Caenorhabditis auriculariae]
MLGGGTKQYLYRSTTTWHKAIRINRNLVRLTPTHTLAPRRVMLGGGTKQYLYRSTTTWHKAIRTDRNLVRLTPTHQLAPS